MASLMTTNNCRLRLSNIGVKFKETDKDIQRMNDLMKQARGLAQEFMFRADDFIVTVLYSSGWEFVIT
jgi:hypothetical protein